MDVYFNDSGIYLLNPVKILTVVPDQFLLFLFQHGPFLFQSRWPDHRLFLNRGGLGFMGLAADGEGDGQDDRRENAQKRAAREVFGAMLHAHDIAQLMGVVMPAGPGSGLDF